MSLSRLHRSSSSAEAESLNVGTKCFFFFSFSQRGSSLMGQHIRSVYSAKLSTSVLTQYFYGGRGIEEVFICNFSTFSKTNLCIYLWIWTEMCVGVCVWERKRVNKYGQWLGIRCIQMNWLAMYSIVLCKGVTSTLLLFLPEMSSVYDGIYTYIYLIYYFFQHNK